MAVIVACWKRLNVPVVAVNEAALALVATTNVDGMLKLRLLLERPTTVEPGAGCVSVTVQVVEEFCPRLLGLQASEDTNTGATSDTVVLAELPL